MQAASHIASSALLGSGELTILEHAYELAVFQICDDGGLYTDLTPDDVQRLLRGVILDELLRTGCDDPERLKKLPCLFAAVKVNPGPLWSAPVVLTW